jgi:beta-aspartyl-peptidase (threonine type)
MGSQPVIVVHGGAWDIPNDLVAAHQAGCRRAVLAGWSVLAEGGSALDAVETAIRIMEDDPVFDAGAGSVLNADGIVEMDAGLMDGRTLDAGAVAAVQNIRNPITLARRVLESEHVLLVGAGANRFAREGGIAECSPEDLVVARERANWERMRAGEGAAGENMFLSGQGTVGAVALDRAGNLAAGTSTGGSPYKRPGRVGDVPLIGCGLYADNELGSVSCTGHGEAITRIVMGKRAVDGLIGGRDPHVVAQETIGFLEERVEGRGGLILLARRGRVGWAFNTPRMAYAWMRQGRSEPGVGI